MAASLRQCNRGTVISGWGNAAEPGSEKEAVTAAINLLHQLKSFMPRLAEEVSRRAWPCPPCFISLLLSPHPLQDKKNLCGLAAC
eukprot:361947-Chlamydomonas_euryale.AAC.14